MSEAGGQAAVEFEKFNPFPGLRPFEPDEDYLFFGRERQTDELLRKLRTARFLSILGTSGSGKSSLVRSGLIPSLYGGAMAGKGSSWRVAILRPGDDPIGNLAAALAAPGALGAGIEDEGLTRAFFETTLRASQRGLVECIRQARIPERDNVLVLIDQFEEIFRFQRSRRVVGRDEAMAFVKLLLQAARIRSVPCYVALTMRSDFVGNCMEFGDLPEVINEGLYLVPRMTRDELRSAIEGPVAVSGSTIAPRLVSRLLNDIGDDLDQLPILQHSLMRTTDLWQADHQAGEPIDLRHYESIGGMQEALSQHAEEALAELDPDGQRVAELMFKALTDRGSDGRGIRRPATVGEICGVIGASRDELAAVVETFRQPGCSFLMPAAGTPLRDNSVLDISHESLMRVWKRLSAWVDEEAQSAQLYLGVARAAARHQAGTAALWRDPELQIALTWRAEDRPTKEWARRYDPAFAEAMRFLDASKAERDRDIREREERRRSKLRRARILALILATATLVFLALGAVAVRQKGMAEQALAEVRVQEQKTAEARRLAERREQEAERQRQEAERQRQEAERAREKAQEQSQLASEQREIAEIERRNAEAKEREARRQRAEADRARLEAESQERLAIAERERADNLRIEAEISEEETLRLSRLAWARALALEIPQQMDQPELAGVLALESYRLNRENRGASEDSDLFGALRVALDRLRPATVIGGHQDGVRAVSMPDRRTMISGSEDGTVRRFALGAPAADPTILGEIGSPIRSLATLPEANLLAAGSADGRILVWDLSGSGSAAREVINAETLISSVALQPGGSLLAFGSHDGRVRLLDLETSGARELPIDGEGGPVLAVAFAPDGKTLVAGLGKRGALSWRLGEQPASPTPLCEDLDVRSLAFSPDGQLLACGGGRGRIELTDLGPAAAASVPLLGHLSSVNSLSFNARGDFLASASSDGTVRLWDYRRPGTQPIVLPGGRAWIWSVAFSPDGDFVVAGSEDRTVRVWPARTERLAAELCRTVTRGLTEEEWDRYMPGDSSYRGERPCPVGG